MSRRKLPTATKLPKALACAMLEDNGRVLFLVRKDQAGISYLELPSIVVPSGRSPFAEIKDAFPKLTGIDGEIHEMAITASYNAGSRKKKAWIPCVVFKVTAKNRTVNPSRLPPEFSGFKWLSLENAKATCQSQQGFRLSKKLDWLRRIQ